jgi:hypothetical protein
MRIVITEQTVEVHLSLWQKILGLMRDIRLSRSEVCDVEVVEDPLREAMSSGMKVGLRVPWLYYAARTIRLDQAFVVRRGVPALGFRVENEGSLKRVLVSTPEAEQLAARLQRP